MKIVVLDGYTENPGDMSWEGFEALGGLTVYDRTPAEETVARIGGAEIVITNKTAITKAVLDACPAVRYVGLLSTGYNIIDLAAAAAKGIVVTNIPSYCTAAVAQFTIALLLEICHHIGLHSDAVHAGRWVSSKDFCFWDYPLIELAGKTLGIIGLGKIGQKTAEIASALGMNVLATGRRADAQSPLARFVPIDELYAKSDVIALHCPLFAETQGMINSESIAKMKDGVILLNTSRGPLIVEEDLAAALASGKVRAAGLDVISTEPMRADNPLLGAKNCIITPHIAWASHESRVRLMQTAVENLQAFLAGNPINTVG